MAFLCEVGAADDLYSSYALSFSHCTVMFSECFEGAEKVTNANVVRLHSTIYTLLVVFVFCL